MGPKFYSNERIPIDNCVTRLAGAAAREGPPRARDRSAPEPPTAEVARR